MYRNWSDITEKLQHLLHRTTATGAECGCQLSVYHKGREVVNICAGIDASAEQRKICRDSLFPVFSCGKAILTTAVLQSIRRREFTLETPVAALWPEFAAYGKSAITVEHILTHRAGLHILPRVKSNAELADWDHMCQLIADRKADAPPGTRTAYHALTFAWLAGNLLMLTENRPLDEILRERILEPCGIDREFFFGTGAEEDKRYTFTDDSAMPQQPSWYKMMIDDPVLRSSCIPSFTACATAGALARFYAALSGDLPGVELLPPELLQLAAGKIWRNAGDTVPDTSWQHFGLGYVLCGPPDDRSSLFGHGGANGSEGFCFRAEHLAVGFTKNRPLPTHPFHPVRDEISDILSIPRRKW